MLSDIILGLLAWVLLGWIGVAVLVVVVCCRGFYRLDADGECRR
jgi:hypothetical protein